MDTIIDEEFNRKPRVIIDNYFRKDFHKPLVSIGYALLAVGLGFVLSGKFIIGPVLLGIGGFFGLTFSGVKLDVANKEAKLYTSLFGYKKGNWTSLKSYPYISILRSKTSFRAQKFNASQMNYSEESFDVYLLSKSHRDRFLIRSEKTEALAKLKPLSWVINWVLNMQTTIHRHRVEKRSVKRQAL
jgi:hypothetical protein